MSSFNSAKPDFVIELGDFKDTDAAKPFNCTASSTQHRGEGDLSETRPLAPPRLSLRLRLRLSCCSSRTTPPDGS